MDTLETLRNHFQFAGTYDLTGLYIELTGRDYRESDDHVDDIVRIIDEDCYSFLKNADKKIVASFLKDIISHKFFEIKYQLAELASKIRKKYTVFEDVPKLGRYLKIAAKLAPEYEDDIAKDFITFDGMASYLKDIIPEAMIYSQFPDKSMVLLEGISILKKALNSERYEQAAMIRDKIYSKVKEDNELTNSFLLRNILKECV
jgi:hypothetical protein